jgi:hypothetical protein
MPIRQTGASQLTSRGLMVRVRPAPASAAANDGGTGMGPVGGAELSCGGGGGAISGGGGGGGAGIDTAPGIDGSAGTVKVPLQSGHFIIWPAY